MTEDSIPRVAERVVDGASTRREAAVRLHDYVRDEIRFEPTLLFDDATPEQTLRLRAGHCNPQAHLLVRLCRAVGIPARMHFVLMRLDVLRGLVPPARGLLFPRIGHHAYVEIELEASTVSVDSFILDRPLHVGALQRLRREARCHGWGAHADGVVDWDGTSDAFSQFVDPDRVLVADAGAVDDPAAFYGSDAFANRPFGLRIGQWLSPARALLGPRLPAVARGALEAVRQEGLGLLARSTAR